MTKRYQQPQSGGQIDWANPLTRGLSFASTGANDFDYAKKAALVYTPVSGTFSTQVTAQGVGSVNTGATCYKKTNTDVFGNGDVTALFIGSPTSGGSNPSMALRQSGDVGSVFLSANSDENDNYVSGQLCLRLLQSGVNRSSVKAAGAIDGSLSCYVIGKSAGSGFAYKNGIPLTATTSGTLAGSPTAVADTINVGTNETNGSMAFGAPLVAVYVWKRRLTDSEIRSISSNPWQVVKAPVEPTLLKTPGATGSAFSVNAQTAPAVGSMAFKSQPAFALNATTAAVVGSMAFGPASRVAVAGNTAPTIGAMAFKVHPVFGVAAITGPTLGAMAFKAQPSLAVNAQTTPVVGAMSFGAASRLSVSAALAPVVGGMAFAAQPKLAVVAQTAPAVGSMAFGPSSRLAINAQTAPVVGSMAFKSQPAFAVFANTAQVVAAMAFVPVPRINIAAILTNCRGNMGFIVGPTPNDSPGMFDAGVSRKTTFACTIAATMKFTAEVVNRG